MEDIPRGDAHGESLVTSTYERDSTETLLDGPRRGSALRSGTNR